MTALIRGELIKAITTRTIFAYAAMAVALAVAQRPDHDSCPRTCARWRTRRRRSPACRCCWSCFGLVGAAGEYRHRTAAPAALAAGRRRGRLLLARAGAYALTGLAVGALTAAVSLAARPAAAGRRAGPGARRRRRSRWSPAGSLVAAALCAIIGVALGALVRNQVVGVVGALIVIFVVCPCSTSPTTTAARRRRSAPRRAGRRPRHGGALSSGQAGLVLVGWTCRSLLAAIVLETPRDLA